MIYSGRKILPPALSRIYIYIYISSSVYESLRLRKNSSTAFFSYEGPSSKGWSNLRFDESCIQGPELIQAVFPLPHELLQIFSLGPFLILLERCGCVVDNQSPATSLHEASLFLFLLSLHFSHCLAALEGAASREG